MSSRKRPLTELSQNQIRTPSRYAPSTPHAIRALQQRSGAKTRSARTRKINDGIVRPDSARGILRQLARITAPHTKKILQTPRHSNGKENQTPEVEEEDDFDYGKRPRTTFNIEDSIEESINEDDSQLPDPPTPSILPDDEDHPTLTFKSIDFGANLQPQSERIDRRRSKLEFADEDDDEDLDEDDPTILTERGRRAISEEPSRRLSRYSFGSIRMSDFGPELEIGRTSDQTIGLKSLREANGVEDPVFDFDDTPLDIGGETENLERLRRSSTDPRPETSDRDLSNIDDFRSDFQARAPNLKNTITSQHEAEHGEKDLNEGDSNNVAEKQLLELSSTQTRKLASIETAVSHTAGKPHRKRLKMTQHGTIVPSLPSTLIKRVATETQKRLGQRKCGLSREHMRALEQATEWFFEQVGEDLEVYSSHAHRKKRVDEADVLMLMRRQRVASDEGELQKLAKDWLPAKSSSELDLPDKL